MLPLSLLRNLEGKVYIMCYVQLVLPLSLLEGIIQVLSHVFPETLCTTIILLVGVASHSANVINIVFLHL